MLTLKAPAKINWFLNILGKRDDGYHELQSLMQKVTLYDVLEFTPADKLTVKSKADIPMEENLVYKAAVLLKETCSIKNGATIHLEKNIPSGAGLGGGSSDAAAALLGLRELWHLELSLAQLTEIAEKIGSDVPFFLSGALSYVYSRGEKLQPCRALKPVNLLLVKPRFDISTAWVYKNFSMLTKNRENVDNIKLFIRNIERTEISCLAGEISNDLESVTISRFPIIAEIKKELIGNGAILSLMSGSGSTVFGVFDRKEKAEEVSKNFTDCWTSVVETVIDGSSGSEAQV